MRETQRTIDEQVKRNRRGEQLKDRRDARFGSVYRRMLLWALDDRIGMQASFVLTFAQLESDTEMSRRSVYRAANELREMGLIDYVETVPNSGLYEWRIIRSNVSALAEESEQAPQIRPRGRPKAEPKPPEKIVPHRQGFACETKPVPHRQNPCLTGKATISRAPQSAPSRPFAEWEGMEEELLKIGMIETETPIAKMRETGCPPSLAWEVIEFWKSRPGCWGVGKLRRRLLNLRPFQTATEFWPEADRPVRAIAEDSAREAIRAMSAVELWDLVDWVLATRELTAPQREFWEMARADAALGHDPKYLPALKAAMAAREKSLVGGRTDGSK